MSDVVRLREEFDSPTKNKNRSTKSSGGSTRRGASQTRRRSSDREATKTTTRCRQTSANNQRLRRGSSGRLPQNTASSQLPSIHQTKSLHPDRFHSDHSLFDRLPAGEDGLTSLNAISSDHSTVCHQLPVTAEYAQDVLVGGKFTEDALVSLSADFADGSVGCDDPWLGACLSGLPPLGEEEFCGGAINRSLEDHDYCNGGPDVGDNHDAIYRASREISAPSSTRKFAVVRSPLVCGGVPPQQTSRPVQVNHGVHL